MSKCIRATKGQWTGLVRLAVVVAVVLAWSHVAFAQVAATPFFATQAVGGISIDAKGIVNRAKPGDLSGLSRNWAQQMQQIPAGLNQTVQMRKVSLRQIAAVLEDCAKSNKPIPDAAMFLAGLQRVHYRVRLSRTKRHRPGRAGRGMASGCHGKRGRRHHRSAGDVAGRLVGGAAFGRGGRAGRHRLLDRPDRRGPSPVEENRPAAGRHGRRGESGGRRPGGGAGNAANHRPWRAGYEPLRQRAGGRRLSHEAAWGWASIPRLCAACPATWK